jgi:hypothetical protein
MQLIDDFEVVILCGILVALVVGYKRIVKQIGQDLGLDEKFANVDKRLDEQSITTYKKFNDLRVSILRTNILLTIHATPDKAEIIEADYKEYKSYGGNSYLDSVVAEWRETYEKPLVNKRIGGSRGKGKSKEEK